MSTRKANTRQHLYTRGFKHLVFDLIQHFKKTIEDKNSCYEILEKRKR